MDLLIRHWSYDPFLLIAGVVTLVHGVGTRRRLRAMRRAGRPTGDCLMRAGLFYAGILVFAVAVDSPIDYWSDYYLFVHMIQHILLAFFGPPLIVLGAPWLALQRGLPRSWRHGLARLIQGCRRSRVLSGLGHLLMHPLTALVLFNGAMIFWHTPGPYDLALENQTVHVWLEHTSFVVFGLLIWLQILDSPPWHPHLDPLRRAGVAFITNFVMVAIAVTLVLFSRDLYPVYAHRPHPLMSLYSDQQVAGSALWICGEFTLAPAIYWNVQLFLRAQGAVRRRGRAAAHAADAARVPWRRGAERWQAASPEMLEMGPR